MIVVLLGTGAIAGPPGQTWSEPVTGMPFVALAKGCFQMGSRQVIPAPVDSYWKHISYTKNLNDDELPTHEVCVNDFWMGQYEVRAGEWQRVRETDRGADAAGKPVAGVTWGEAREFAQQLSEHSGGKYRFRLPTEAEWEYACRAGLKEEPAKPELERQAWFGVAQVRDAVPHEAGQRLPNAWGLHDMLGNVWEWTADSYLADGYARHVLYNPKMVVKTPQRVIRGGSARTELAQMRCAMRGHQDGDAALGLIGFRLVREK